MTNESTSDYSSGFELYTSSVDSYQEIEGTFCVHGNGNCFGVHCVSGVGGVTDVSGNFYSNSSKFAYGVCFDTTEAMSIQNISGNFSCYSSATMSSDGYVFGTCFNYTNVGSVQNITGNFCLCSEVLECFGVNFLYGMSGTTTVDGKFAICVNSTQAVCGVKINPASFSGSCNGTPTFYSNKADSGD
jgi:hypothetical protein